MATSNDITASEDIVWTDIGPDGTETQRFGFVWAQATNLAGMRAWWVIPEGLDGEPGQGPPVLVARASRRHIVGRDIDGRWYREGGRYVDVGECFRETDPRSRFTRTFVPPRHAMPRRTLTSTSRTAFAAFAALCEQAERERGA